MFNSKSTKNNSSSKTTCFNSKFNLFNACFKSHKHSDDYDHMENDQSVAKRQSLDETKHQAAVNPTFLDDNYQNLTMDLHSTKLYNQNSSIINPIQDQSAINVSTISKTSNKYKLSSSVLKEQTKCLVQNGYYNKMDDINESMCSNQSSQSSKGCSCCKSLSLTKSTQNDSDVDCSVSLSSSLSSFESSDESFTELYDEFICCNEYVAKSDEELSVKYSDKVKLLTQPRNSDKYDYLYVHLVRNGKSGFVPKSSLTTLNRFFCVY